MSVPKVSVLIPNYNHERYLPARIESVLNQTFTDFELLLMDDCSTDGSRAVLEAYAAKDSRIRLLFNEQNSGSTFRQWKKGIAAARGGFIWIAESDDYAAVTFLETLVRILNSDPSIGLAYSNSAIVNENDKVIGDMADWKNSDFRTSRWSRSWVRDGLEEIEEYLRVTCTINNASSVLFRVSAMIEAGGVDDSFRYAGDWFMYIKICLNNKIAFESQKLNYYREHSANASKQAQANSMLIAERLLCFSYLYKRLRNVNVRDKLILQAGVEYMALIYNCLKRKWQPKNLFLYVYKIFNSGLKFAFYLHISLVKKILGIDSSL